MRKEPEADIYIYIFREGGGGGECEVIVTAKSLVSGLCLLDFP